MLLKTNIPISIPGKHTTRLLTLASMITVALPALCIAYILLILTSLASNSVLIHIIRTRQFLKTATSHLILNQACADLIATLTSMPVMFSDSLFHREWFRGKEGLVTCKFAVWVFFLPTFCSVSTLTAIAIDRYFGVTRPLQSSPISLHIRLVIVGLWIWAIGSAAGMKIMAKIVFLEGHFICLIDYSHVAMNAWNVTALCLLLLNFLVPLLAMTVLYSIVSVRLWSRDPPGEGTNRDQRQIEVMKTAKKVSQMMTAVVVLFVLCWCPFHAFVGLYCLHKISLPYPALKFIVWLSNAYSAVNPFVYFYFNSNFKQEIKVIFGKCCRWPKC